MNLLRGMARAPIPPRLDLGLRGAEPGSENPNDECSAGGTLPVAEGYGGVRLPEQPVLRGGRVRLGVREGGGTL